MSSFDFFQFISCNLKSATTLITNLKLQGPKDKELNAVKSSIGFFKKHAPKLVKKNLIEIHKNFDKNKMKHIKSGVPLFAAYSRTFSQTQDDKKRNN